MTSVLYSYPPGSGGDHLIKMLLDDHCMHGRTVINHDSLKVSEHEANITGDNAALLQKISELFNRGSRVIGCHETKFYNNLNAIKIRAVWSDPTLDHILSYRDIITNDFLSSVPPSYQQDHVLVKVMQMTSLSERRRKLLFIKHFLRHQPTFSSFPAGWESFPLDRIFSELFIDDVAMLALKIGLEPNRERYRFLHRKWLAQNPIEDFTLRNAVRKLETVNFTWNL